MQKQLPKRVLFVSHSLEQIRSLCDRVAWLDHGKLVNIGPTEEICSAYEAFMRG